MPKRSSGEDLSKSPKNSESSKKSPRTSSSSSSPTSTLTTSKKQKITHAKSDDEITKDTSTPKVIYSSANSKESIEKQPASSKSINPEHKSEKLKITHKSTDENKTDEDTIDSYINAESKSVMLKIPQKSEHKSTDIDSSISIDNKLEDEKIIISSITQEPSISANKSTPQNKAKVTKSIEQSINLEESENSEVDELIESSKEDELIEGPKELIKDKSTTVEMDDFLLKDDEMNSIQLEGGDDDEGEGSDTTADDDELIEDLIDEEESEEISEDEEESSECSESSVDSEDPIGIEELKQKLYEELSEIPDDFENFEYFNNLTSLIDEFEEDEVSIKRSVIDGIFRSFLIDRIVALRLPWTNLVKLSIKLSTMGAVSPPLPITLLVDLLDLLGLGECEKVFEFIEERLELWQEPHFFNSVKNPLLRMCNDLLRRLSQTSNTTFCGRILIFLSTYFPFSERSGLNTISEFNSTENFLICPEEEDSKMAANDDSVKVSKNERKLFEGLSLEYEGLDKILEEFEEEEDKKEKLNVDHGLYLKFWKLQEYLRSPTSCYVRGEWDNFTKHVGDLLLALESSKLLNQRKDEAQILVEEGEVELNSTEETPIEVIDLENEEGQSSSSKNKEEKSSERAKRGFNVPKLSDKNHYFAKYLTNRRVLELEMSDGGFRRSFLVQILIVLQYLLLPVKFKTESQVLSEEQEGYVKKTTDRIYNILLQIKPGGASFVSNIKHIFKREEIWNKWKNEGCLPVQKSKVGDDDKNDVKNGDEFKAPPGAKKERPRLGLILQAASKKNMFSLGNAELNRLWNICPDNLEACRSKARDFVPTLENYFSEAMKELDAEPIVPFDPKKELKPKKILGDANFGWRGLRLLARRSPYFFQMVSGTPIHPRQSYLEFVLRKIVADMENNSNSTPTNLPSSSSSSENLTTSLKQTKDKKSTESSTTGPPPPKKFKDHSTTTKEKNDKNKKGEEMEISTSGPSLDEGFELSKTSTYSGENEESGAKLRDERGERGLSEREILGLGKKLGSKWKILAPKLGFTPDEIEYFSTEKRESGGEFMLRMWSEQEGEDATVADLLYRSDAVGLKSIVESIVN